MTDEKMLSVEEAQKIDGLGAQTTTNSDHLDEKEEENHGNENK